MPIGTPSTTRRPFTDSDDRELVAFLAVHHPSKEGRMGNAVYKLLTEQPNKWPWGKRHTWMSWRERYKNHEGRFDHHIKVFQQKNKLSRRPVPIGFGAMLMSGMEDLDDFGTEEEEEEEIRQRRGKRAARFDSDSDDEYGESAKAPPRPVSKVAVTPKQPISKRKRVSDATDRTPKRTRVTVGGRNGVLEGGSSSNGPFEEKEGDAMDQDSQGEETLEVEQNLFYPSDEETIVRSYDNSLGCTPKRHIQPPRTSDPVASTSQMQHPSQPREPVHRPHSPKNPTPSPFSTVDLDESDGESPLIPKRLRKRTVPKIVESAFGRNEQDGPFRSSQVRADSPPESEFELLVEKRAARKAGASKDPEARSTGDDVTWEGMRDSEPGPSTPSTSKRGSVEPRGSSLLSVGKEQPAPRLRPEPSATTDVTEKKMIEAREELSKLALRFRDRFPRSPLGPKSPGTRINDNDEGTHPFDDTTHPFDETTHPFDETTHPFDETTHLINDSQTQTQEAHPFDDDSHIPSQDAHPFDENTQQPPDSMLDDSQSQLQGLEVGTLDTPMRDSPAPPTPVDSKHRTEASLTTTLLESRNSRTHSHPQPISPINRLRPGLLSPPRKPPRSPQIFATNEPVTVNGTSRRLKAPTPTTSRSSLRTPLSPTGDGTIISPRRVRSGALSPEEGRPRSTATQELRELLENSPRGRRAMGHVEVPPQTHEKLPMPSERKQLAHRTRLSEPSVKQEILTPGYHLRSKSTANDDPFSSPIGLRLSSPHPPADATIDDEQQSPLAPLTTSQSGLDATIRARQVRREAAQDRNRRSHGLEHPSSPKSLRPATTTIAAGTSLRKSKAMVETSVQTGEEEYMDGVDESQTYDIEGNLQDVSGTPMMDLSFRPPKRIPPTYRASYTRHERSSVTDSRDYDYDRERERNGDVRKPSSSRFREREDERDEKDNREQGRTSRRLSGISFGSPIAASSPQNARRTGRGQSHDRDKLDRTTSSTSFSSRPSFGASTSTAPPAVGIMAGPLGLGFTPSEMDAYLGIQVACEKIAKTHGFQSDAVFRVYQEVKDLRKAEEIVIGMKRAAEKNAVERIMRVREKTERRRMSERSGESSSHWDGDGGHSRTSRRGYDVRDEEEEEEEDQETDPRIIYEEEEDDPDSPLREERPSHRSKRASTSTTSALRYRGGHDRSRTSSTTTRTRKRSQVHDREGSTEYHPPTPTRANLWERLSKSGKHPETALMGESLRASLSMPRYEDL